MPSRPNECGEPLRLARRSTLLYGVSGIARLWKLETDERVRVLNRQWTRPPRQDRLSAQAGIFARKHYSKFNSSFSFVTCQNPISNNIYLLVTARTKKSSISEILLVNRKRHVMLATKSIVTTLFQKWHRVQWLMTTWRKAHFHFHVTEMLTLV